jgi:predicted amidophosphoribosyltransferase
MTLCYFCEESFTPNDEYIHICPECHKNLIQHMDRHATTERSLDDYIKLFNHALRDFANDLPKRFVKKRTLK